MSKELAKCRWDNRLYEHILNVFTRTKPKNIRILEEKEIKIESSITCL